MRVESNPGRVGRVERFHRFCVDVTARLPLGLNAVVAPTFLGFVLINSFTFFVDLVILTDLPPSVSRDPKVPLAAVLAFGAVVAGGCLVVV